ncbi:MAG: ATP-binding protein [Desulfobacterales bacterium]|nr:ATP-binding protein [Desulfobacterales bacterium]
MFLLAWQEHGQKLIDDLNMKRTIQPGYRALFYGPSGTGKTITASLIGKKTGMPVYRVDISQMVSKYIGETEKNLEKIFNAAEEHNWILFFDEADALFGKRTSIGTSNDKHANQETAYLLQRIETCTNIVILATNLKKNLDEAFTRRFQSIIYFPVPDKKERKRLWEGVFTEDVVLDDEINLEEVAQKYDIAGGSIVNVARFSTLMALSGDTAFISKDSLMEGIKREHAKLGRTI